MAKEWITTELSFEIGWKHQHELQIYMIQKLAQTHAIQQWPNAECEGREVEELSELTLLALVAVQSLWANLLLFSCLAERSLNPLYIQTHVDKRP